MMLTHQKQTRTNNNQVYIVSDSTCYVCVRTSPRWCLQVVGQPYGTHV